MSISNALIKSIFSSNIFVKTIGHSLQTFFPSTRIFQKSLFRMLQLKEYFYQIYSIKLIFITLSSHPHVYFTNHYFERINPNQRIFIKRVKTQPYSKQKFDDSGEQKGEGEKLLSGCETSSSLSTGSDNSANLETWSNTRPCNVRPASVNVARFGPSPHPVEKDGACTRTRASINIWAGSPKRWTVARAIGTVGYIIHAR